MYMCLTYYTSMQDVHRDVTVRALNATEFRLVDVISYILGYLKTELLESHLNTHGYTFTAADFDWVVTVPAIWRARGKRMMREAAYLVSECVCVCVCTCTLCVYTWVCE